MPKKKFNVFGLISVLFLLVTLVVAVWATDNPLKRYLLRSKACESAQECADARVRREERRCAYEGGAGCTVCEDPSDNCTKKHQCRGSECYRLTLSLNDKEHLWSQAQINSAKNYCNSLNTDFDPNTGKCVNRSQTTVQATMSPSEVAEAKRTDQKDCQAQGWIYRDGWCYPQVDPDTFYDVALGQGTTAQIEIVTSYCLATSEIQNDPKCKNENIQNFSIDIYGGQDALAQRAIRSCANTSPGTPCNFTPKEYSAIQQFCFRQYGGAATSASGQHCLGNNLDNFVKEYIFDQQVQVVQQNFQNQNPNATPLPKISYDVSTPAPLGSFENPYVDYLTPEFADSLVDTTPEYAVCQGKDNPNTSSNEQDVCNQNLQAIENTEFLGIGNYVQSFAPGSENTYYYWNRKGYSSEQECIANDSNPESCGFVSTDLYKDRLVTSSVTGVQVANILVGGYYLVNAIPAAIAAYNASLATSVGAEMLFAPAANAALSRAILSGGLSLASSLGTAANTYFLGQSAAQSIQLCAYGQEGCGLSLAYTALSFANTTFSMYSFGLSTAISNSIINSGQISRELFISSARARMMNIPLSFINTGVSGVQTYQYCAQYGVDGHCLFQSSMTALIAAGGVSDYIYLRSLYQSLQPIVQVEGIVDDFTSSAITSNSLPDVSDIIDGSVVPSTDTAIVSAADDFSIAMGVEPAGIPINTAPNPNLGSAITGSALSMVPDLRVGIITNSQSLENQLSVPTAIVPAPEPIVPAIQTAPQPIVLPVISNQSIALLPITQSTGTTVYISNTNDNVPFQIIVTDNNVVVSANTGQTVTIYDSRGTNQVHTNTTSAIVEPGQIITSGEKLYVYLGLGDNKIPILYPVTNSPNFSLIFDEIPNSNGSMVGKDDSGQIIVVNTTDPLFIKYPDGDVIKIPPGQAVAVKDDMTFGTDEKSINFAFIALSNGGLDLKNTIQNETYPIVPPNRVQPTFLEYLDLDTVLTRLAGDGESMFSGLSGILPKSIRNPIINFLQRLPQPIQKALEFIGINIPDKFMTPSSGELLVKNSESNKIVPYSTYNTPETLNPFLTQPSDKLETLINRLKNNEKVTITDKNGKQYRVLNEYSRGGENVAFQVAGSDGEIYILLVPQFEGGENTILIQSALIDELGNALPSDLRDHFIHQIGLVSLSGSNEPDGLLIEYLDGKNLRSAMYDKTGLLTPDEVLTLLRIATIWDKAGLYHGDIYPTNIARHQGKIVIFDPSVQLRTTNDAQVIHILSETGVTSEYIPANIKSADGTTLITRDTTKPIGEQITIIPRGNRAAVLKAEETGTIAISYYVPRGNLEAVNKMLATFKIQVGDWPIIQRPQPPTPLGGISASPSQIGANIGLETGDWISERLGGAGLGLATSDMFWSLIEIDYPTTNINPQLTFVKSLTNDVRLFIDSIAKRGLILTVSNLPSPAEIWTSIRKVGIVSQTLFNIMKDRATINQRFVSQSPYHPGSSAIEPITALEKQVLQRMKGIQSFNDMPTFSTALDSSYGHLPLSSKVASAKSLNEAKAILIKNGITLEMAGLDQLGHGILAWAVGDNAILINPTTPNATDWIILKPTLVHEVAHIDLLRSGNEALATLGTGDAVNDTALSAAISKVEASEDIPFLVQGRAALEELLTNDNLTPTQIETLKTALADAIKFYNWVVFGDVMPIPKFLTTIGDGISKIWHTLAVSPDGTLFPWIPDTPAINALQRSGPGALQNSYMLGRFVYEDLPILLGKPAQPTPQITPQRAFFSITELGMQVTIFKIDSKIQIFVKTDYTNQPIQLMDNLFLKIDDRHHGQVVVTDQDYYLIIRGPSSEPTNIYPIYKGSQNNSLPMFLAKNITGLVNLYAHLPKKYMVIKLPNETDLITSLLKMRISVPEINKLLKNINGPLKIGPLETFSRFIIKLRDQAQPNGQTIEWNRNVNGEESFVLQEESAFQAVIEKAPQIAKALVSYIPKINLQPVIFAGSIGLAIAIGVAVVIAILALLWLLIPKDNANALPAWTQTPTATQIIETLTPVVTQTPFISNGSTPTSTQTPSAPKGVADFATAIMSNCVQGDWGYFNACIGQYFHGIILTTTEGVTPIFGGISDSPTEHYWCTDLVWDSAIAAGYTFSYEIAGALNMYEDFVAKESVILSEDANYNPSSGNIESGMVAFVSKPNLDGSYSVAHVGIVSEITVTDTGTYVTIVQANAPTVTATYELDSQGRLVMYNTDGTPYYIRGFGDIDTYAQNQ